MYLGKLAAAVALVASLGACGQSFGEQAVIGAGAGGASSVVLGGNVATGALVGAAANVAYCQQFPSRCN